MADTLKFGPEWLRALSGGNSVSSPPSSPGYGNPKYKLAQYRYGREEMLALYSSHKLALPECLKQFSQIVLDKPQKPMALAPLSDEEQLLMTQSVNSTSVGRIMSRGGGVRGRGAPDRGRGRGRGRSEGFHRMTSFEEDSTGFSRRYGVDETGPPRRELLRSVSSQDNWRDRDNGKREDEGNTESGNDWRRGGSRWPLRREWQQPGEPRGYFSEEMRGSGRFDHLRSRDRNHNSSSSYDDGVEVPEWSMDDFDDGNALGTFDSSGAFLSMKELREGEENFVKTRKRSQSEGDGLDKIDTDDSKPADTSDNTEKDCLEDKAIVEAVEKSEIIPDDQFKHLEKATEDFLDKMTSEDNPDNPDQVPGLPEEVAIDPREMHNVMMNVGTSPLNAQVDMWLYRDPQGEVQGPFHSAEMAQWFSAGYFQINLMVKRVQDGTFQPLGELIKLWGRVPFLHAESVQPPVAASVIVAQQIEQQKQAILEQQHQQATQKQLIQQIHHLLPILKRREDFSNLSQEQQNQVALQIVLKNQRPNSPNEQQQQLKQQQQLLQAQMHARMATDMAMQARAEAIQRSNSEARGKVVNAVVTAAKAGFSRSMSQPGELANATEIGVWGRAIKAQQTLVSQNAGKQSWNSGNVQSVWDLEEEERVQSIVPPERPFPLERQRARLEQEARKEAERRRQEEEKRIKMEEERIAQEQSEELKRNQIEEQRRLEEEQRINEELQRKQEEDARKQEELKFIEQQRQKEMADIQRQEELNIEEQKRVEMKRKEEEVFRIAEQKRIKLQKEEIARRQDVEVQKAKVESPQNILPATVQWVQLPKPPVAMSLSEIQEREAAEQHSEQERLLEVHQNLVETDKNQPATKSWACQSNKRTVHSPVQSLIEIQMEQNSTELTVASEVIPAKPIQTWNNKSGGSSNWASEGAWGRTETVAQSGFWDEAIGASGPVGKKSNKSNSSFPSLSPTVAVANNGPTSTKGKNSSSKKKEEDRVQQLFKPSTQDKFSQWCTEMLKGLSTSLDVPTFVEFLRTLESPYEIHDYVREYLGDNDESQVFAKLFIEKRSAFRKQSKPEKQEKSMWGPAPAVNPACQRSSNLSNSSDDAKSTSRKKKKGKMQKVSGNLLGFTVHAAPDRRVGEIENIETS